MKKESVSNKKLIDSGKRKKTVKNREDFFDRVFKIVAQIPRGKVTTYGAIAEVCGIKSSARAVGWALNSAAGSDLPCHRVVNRNGALTGKIHFASPTLMEDLLKSESVEFDDKGCVKMEKYFWHPKKNPQKNLRATRGERRCN